MNQLEEIHFLVNRAKFFEIGRILKKNWHSSDLGPVSLTASGGKLIIMSKQGGGELPCEGDGEISAKLTATQFRKLIAAERKQSLSGSMKLTFRPAFGEVAIDIAGVKARFY